MIRKSKSIANEIDDKKRVITISFVLSWIFGALFLLSGVTSIFTKPLIGLMMLVMAAALLPPIVNKFENKFNIKITRNIKTFVLLACFFVIVVIGSIEGEIRQTKQEKIAKESIVPKSSPRNSHKTGTPSNTVLKELSPDTHSTSLKVVCNKFNVQATLKDSKLTFSLDTDLPDNTKVMVSVCRLYWKSGSSKAYVISYHQTKSSVGALRYLSMVKLDDDRWSLDLQKKQKLLAKMGEPFEISRISDDVKIDLTVPINQDNPAFGHRNKNLVGPMVTDSGSLRVISVEKKFKAPYGGVIGYPEELVERIEKVEVEKKIEKKKVKQHVSTVMSEPVKEVWPVQKYINDWVRTEKFIISSDCEGCDSDDYSLTHVHFKLDIRYLGNNPKMTAKQFSDHVALQASTIFKRSFCIYTYYGNHNKLSRSCE